MRTLYLILVILFLLLGGAVLIVWPAAALASVMGLAGHVPRETNKVLLLFAYLFYGGVLCYPIIYIACLILSITLLVIKKSYAMLCALLPIFYICLISTLFMFLSLGGA